MDTREYKSKFRGKSTTWHLRTYREHNDEYRKYARKELIRRKVPLSILRLHRIIRKTPKGRQTRSIYGIRIQRGGIWG
ncbi:MAG: hypothetical protein WD512_13250 [Candidatus Paceibacterota bacterium]